MTTALKKKKRSISMSLDIGAHLRVTAVNVFFFFVSFSVFIFGMFSNRYEKKTPACFSKISQFFFKNMKETF